MRTAIVLIMVASFFVLGLNDLVERNWKTGVASILLGIVQALFFWKGMK